MKNLIWYLVAGSKGGITRGRIIEFLRETPSNANKIAEMLKLDYKTVRHHLKILQKNNALTVENKDNYGAVYFISEIMNANMKIFDDIWARFGKK